MSRLGLGLAAVGRPAYINLGRDTCFEDRSIEAMQARTHALLDAAMASGMRYVDTARSYGYAERFLGDWLRARRLDLPDNLFVASKWGYAYTGDWRMDAEIHEKKDHSVDQLERQWPESQTSLGQMPDLYQIHSATFETGVLEDTAVITALGGLKEIGVGIGLSVSGPKQADIVDRALEVNLDGVPLFDAVQASWNLLEQSCGPALARAHESGLRVIVKEGVANGLLTPANTEGPSSDRLGRLWVLAERHDVSVDAVALAGVLINPWADIVLSGASNLAQLESNQRAVALVEALDSRDCIEPLNPENYWAERGKRAWQ